MKRQLGKFETAQAVTNEHFPFNAVISLCLENGPSPGTLVKALELLQKRHMLLQTQIEKNKKQFFFVTSGASEIPLDIIERNGDYHWRGLVEKELNFKINAANDPPIRVNYLTTLDRWENENNENDENDKSDLVITFLHPVIDAPTGANFLHELLSFCRELEEGRLPRDHGVHAILPPAETFFPPPHKGFRRIWKIFTYMMRQIGDELSFRVHSKGKRKAPIHASGNCKILPMVLSADLTDSLWKHARKNRVTVNNLFNAALMLAVQKHLYNGDELPMRNFNFPDLRLYLKPPPNAEYLGCYFSLIRHTVNIPAEISVWDLAEKIGAIVYPSYKRGDKFYANLLSLHMMRALLKFRSFRMGHTALSFTGPLFLSNRYGNIQIKDIHAFVSNFVLGPEYTAQVRMWNNCFYWDILFMDSDMNYKQAEEIAEEIRSILVEAVEKSRQRNE